MLGNRNTEGVMYVEDTRFVDADMEQKELVPLLENSSSPDFVVSVSLGNSVDFKLRRHTESQILLRQFCWGAVTLWSRTGRHDWSSKISTYPKLQELRVYLTFTWISQHIFSCTPAKGICRSTILHAKFARAGSWGDRGAETYLGNLPSLGTLRVCRLTC